MYRLFLTVILASAILGAVYSQDTESSAEGSAEGDSSAETSASEEGEEGEDSSQSSDSDAPAVTQVIEWPYEELVSIATDLGIDSSGNRYLLQERLKDVLGTDYQPNRSNTASTSGTGSTSGRSNIENADRGGYRQVGPDNELVLEGNVSVVVQDGTNGVTNVISADFILFNQSSRQLSARGNVEYVIEGGSTTESFTGDQLLFLLNENDTLFFGGGGFSEQDATDEALRILNNLRGDTRVQFHYQAEFITRNSDNIIIMDRGTIASTRDPSPTFRFQFEKLWLLSPGEVGVEGLALYVGNIPIFGLPFLYLPGNEVVFNPVFVLNDQRGIGLNTTTYFVGQKDRNDALFSFLQIGDDVGESATRPLGIFLQPVDSSDNEGADANASNDTADAEAADADAAEEGAVPSPEDVLKSAKLYLDAYAKRGAFIGFEADFVPGDIVSTAKGLALLAFTREVYSIGQETTSLFQDNNSLVWHWHESRLGSVRIPFRYILDIELSLKIDFFTLGIDIPIYSDPTINGEFFARQENIPWDDLIFGTNIEDQEISTAQQTMNWNINFALNPTVPSEIRPFINSFSFGSFRTQFLWQIQREDNNNLPPEHSTALNSPERLFYSPNRFELPSGTVSIAGNLIQFPPTAQSSGTSDPETEEDEEEEPGNIEQFQIPSRFFADPERSGTLSRTSTSRLEQDSPFIQPSLESTTSAASVSAPFSYSLEYSASNRHNIYLIYNEFDTNDYDIAYTDIEDSISASLTQGFQIFGSLFSVQNLLRYSGTIRNRSNFSSRLSEAQITTNTNAIVPGRHNLNLDNSLSVNFLEAIQTSLAWTASYQHSLRLWDYTIGADNSEVENIFEWDAEHVTNHRLATSISIPLASNLFRNNFSFSFVLPPQDENINLGYTFGLGPFGEGVDFSLTGGTNVNITNVNDEILPRDLNFNFTTQIFKEVSFNGTFRWNIEADPLPEQYQLGLKIFWYNASISWLDTQVYELNNPNNPSAWVIPEGRSGDTEFQLSNMTHALTIPISIVEEDSFELNSSIGLTWNHEFIRFTNSTLNFNFSISILIPRFLFVRFTASSSNNNFYRYFAEYNQILGTETLNLFNDLFSSFNFASDAAREASNFKLDTLGVELYHNVGDWLLSFSYNWRPILETQNGITTYRIENRFAFFVQWLPLEEINEEVTFEVDFDSGDLEIDY